MGKRKSKNLTEMDVVCANCSAYILNGDEQLRMYFIGNYSFLTEEREEYPSLMSNEVELTKKSSSGEKFFGSYRIKWIMNPSNMKKKTNEKITAIGKSKNNNGTESTKNEFRTTTDSNGRNNDWASM